MVYTEKCDSHCKSAIKTLLNVRQYLLSCAKNVITVGWKASLNSLVYNFILKSGCYSHIL